jgi:DNA-nicking Smr family endonuclease
MTRRSQRSSVRPDVFDPLDGSITDEIDLHGLTSAQARERVRTGLEQARSKTPGGLIHIITGKGRNSVGQPVLLSLVRSMLSSGRLPEVATWGLDYDDGGYLVRLRGGRS